MENIKWTNQKNELEKIITDFNNLKHEEERKIELEYNLAEEIELEKINNYVNNNNNTYNQYIDEEIERMEFEYEEYKKNQKEILDCKIKNIRKEKIEFEDKKRNEYYNLWKKQKLIAWYNTR